MACDEAMGVGKNGVIPWNDSEDRLFFHQCIGNSPLICGRKTFETLPPKILSNNRSLGVLSRNTSFNGHLNHINENHAYENITVLDNTDKLLSYIQNQEENVFLIGGKQAIDLCLELNLIQVFILTKIQGLYSCDIGLDEKMFQNFQLISREKNFYIFQLI